MDSLNYDLLDPMKSSTRKHPVSSGTKETPHGKPIPRRPSAAQNVDEDPRVVVGVDIGGSNLRVALADLGGTVLGKWSASTKETSSPEMVIAQIGKGIDSLLKDSSASRSSLAAIAAGAPGITDREAGVVVATSYLRGWRDVPFQSLLESAFHIPAAVENDVRMAALGEHWMGVARGISNFVFLAIGTGIAAGIFANGTLLRGARCTAGEVGYMYVPGASEQVAQRGTPGSLESTIGGEGIRQQWLAAGYRSLRPCPHWRSIGKGCFGPLGATSGLCCLQHLTRAESFAVRLRWRRRHERSVARCHRGGFATIQRTRSAQADYQQSRSGCSTDGGDSAGA